MSEEHKQYLKKQRTRKIVIRIIQIGILILIFGIWELSAYLEWADPFITSSPSRVVKSIANLYTSGQLFTHLGATLWETVISFILSTVLGTAIAVILWWSETVRRVLEPYLIVLNSLPKVALGPLIIIWVGAGRSAIVTMALMICLIITVISALTGFMSVDEEKIQLMRSMGANKFQILTKLILPANIPNILSILKINVGLSWVGTIMGEYLVSREGIGYLLVYGSQVFKLDLVMASTLMLCVLATAMYLVVALIEKLIGRYY
ncbi:MAG: ABC transporter permease [Firmicutes bacterium]|uniref:ABC transporter permease n=1 Tax=Candidatus Stercoripulliclostridium pullicola TaxID=2840953 RepID=A0A940DJ66_9FIRM|nr:ABC transporter permease [Candidatus Stercoripulliclostridium pullicola]